MRRTFQMLKKQTLQQKRPETEESLPYYIVRRGSADDQFDNAIYKPVPPAPTASRKMPGADFKLGLCIGVFSMSTILWAFRNVCQDGTAAVRSDQQAVTSRRADKRSVIRQRKLLFAETFLDRRTMRQRVAAALLIPPSSLPTPRKAPLATADGATLSALRGQATAAPGREAVHQKWQWYKPSFHNPRGQTHQANHPGWPVSRKRRPI